MGAEQTLAKALSELERALNRHEDAEVKNLHRLRCLPHAHTVAVCTVLSSLVKAFRGRKLVFLVEAELSRLGCMTRPEDVVAWIEDIGIFVVEVKSHKIGGIRAFENNVPQVVYHGKQEADTDLLDQPRDFAYKLRTQLQTVFSSEGVELPPLYFAGWLPNVSPLEVAARGAEVAPDRVWLSDMLDKEVFLARIPSMNNLTRGKNAGRSSLELFSLVFGVTSGLRQNTARRPVRRDTMGALIDQRNRQLKILTQEQQDLAFSENLIRGPKVIHGVAGSGKTVVLANAVAELFLRELARQEVLLPLAGTKSPPFRVLVLCFNRVLVSYLHHLINRCFESRKRNSAWKLPLSRITVINIDKFAWNLAKNLRCPYSPGGVAATVEGLLKKGLPPVTCFDHIFIDEGQDIHLDWYPFIRSLAKPNKEEGRSIIIFYDDAQSLYAAKRPGVGGTQPWKDLLGSVPLPRGLRTIMRVGHRNTNQILSFSYNLLLGAFAKTDPEMAQFAGLSAYENEKIPNEPSLDHPNAGKACVERIDGRQYRVNFAVSEGPLPIVHHMATEAQLLDDFLREVKRLLGGQGCDVAPEDVLVMAPTQEAVSKLLTVLQGAGIPTHCPVPLDPKKNVKPDPRDLPFFQEGKVTVSTIKSAKGYTAHVCLVAFVHELDGRPTKEECQRCRAELHVACTRATLFLELWGLPCSFMEEAQKAHDALKR